MTPAEELRSAAAKLREMAAKTSGGPWTLVKNIQERTGSHMQSTWTRPGKTQAVNPGQHDDYAWITLMGPDKAELLACWLDVAARMTDIGCRMAGRESLSVEQRAARDFARTILGDHR